MNAQTSSDRENSIELTLLPPWLPKPLKENTPIFNRYKSVSQNVNTEYEYWIANNLDVDETLNLHKKKKLGFSNQ